MDKIELDKKRLLYILEKRVEKSNPPKGHDLFYFYLSPKFLMHDPEKPFDMSIFNDEDGFLNVEEDYILKLLYEIESDSGGRFKVSNPTLSLILKGLSEEDIKNEFYWYAFEVVFNPKIQNADNSIKGKIDFNSQTGVLRFGDVSHGFQRGKDGDKMKLNLFRKLWENRKYIKSGVEIIKGESKTSEFLACTLGLVPYAKDLERMPSKKEEFTNLIKSINKFSKSKGFPFRVERKNGVQLIISEK